MRAATDLSPPTAAPLEPPPARDPRRWAVLGGVWLVYLCFGLISFAMAPLVAPIRTELDIDNTTMGAILGAWPLVYIATALAAGRLTDRIGVRRALLLALALMTLSAVLRAAAADALTLFLAVGLFGVGGPLVSVGAPKLIRQWFDETERGTAMGIYITGPSLGGIVALILTPAWLLPVTGSWRTCLLVYAGFTAVSALAWLWLSRAERGRPVPRAAGAQSDFRALLALRPVRLMLLMAIGIFFYNHGLNNWLPVLLQSHGMSATAAGLWASLPTAVGIVGALIIPRHALAGRRLPMLLGLFACAAVAALLLRSAELPLLASGLVLQGITRSSMMTLALLVLMHAPGVDEGNAGTAGGLFFTAAEVGGVLGPLLVGVALDASGSFDLALGIMVGVCIALLGLGRMLQREG